MSFKFTTGGTRQLELGGGSVSTSPYRFYNYHNGEWELQRTMLRFLAHLEEHDLEESFLRDMKDLFPEEYI